MIKRKSAHWPLKVTTYLVLISCFTLTLSILTFSQNLKNFLTLWGEDFQITAYIASDVSSSQLMELQKQVESLKGVGAVVLFNQEKTLSGFREQMASYAPDILNDEELLSLIPASFQVKVSSSVLVADQDRVMTTIAQNLQKMVGIEEVSYGQEWVQKYGQIVTAIQAFVWIVIAIVILAVLFVISNSLRATIEGRREDIVILEMVGATYGSIRKPFMIEGALFGGLSSLVAIGFTWMFYASGRNFFSQKLQFLQLGEALNFLSVPWLMLFVLICASVGACASYFCVSKINTGFSGSSPA